MFHLLLPFLTLWIISKILHKINTAVGRQSLPQNNIMICKAIYEKSKCIPYVNYAYPNLKFLWEGKLCSIIYTLVFHLNSWFIGSSVWNHLVLQLVIMRSFPHLWLITRFVTSATWQVPHMEQGPHTFHENLSSPAVVSGVHIARSVFSM